MDICLCAKKEDQASKEGSSAWLKTLILEKKEGSHFQNSNNLFSFGVKLDAYKEDI